MNNMEARLEIVEQDANIEQGNEVQEKVNWG